MSSFRLRLHKATAPTNPISFNSLFGTATDASNGRITFGLKPGCRRIYVGTGGSDANDGLTPATRKLTLNGAIAVYAGAGFTAGDQLMIAQGSSLTDDGSADLFRANGASLTYPNAVLSYDPADPTNTAKFGWALGGAQPVINLSTSINSSLRGASVFAVGKDYLAVQGITFAGVYDASISSTSTIGFGGKRTGLCFQNTRWQKASLYLDLDETQTTANWGSTFLVSQSSGYGQYRGDGNKSWLYISGTDGFTIQDCIGVHCGWKMGAGRSDGVAAGGAHFLGHGIYLAAENTNVVIDRVIGIDPAQDMFSLRGSWTGSCFVSIDAPIFNTFGGYSGPATEWPQGSLCKLESFTVAGGADINSSEPAGQGFGIRNTVAGSYIKNGAMFDNPIFLGVNNVLVSANNDVSSLAVAALIDNVRSYSFANYGGAQQAPNGGAYSGQIAITWTNCINDTMAPGGAGNGNSAWGSAPSGYKTRAQLYGALGFTADTTLGKRDLVNWVTCYPHLAGEFAMAINTVGLQSMGLSPTKHPVRSVPSLSGLAAPTAIY